MFDSLSSDTLAALLLLIAISQFKRIGGFLNLSRVRLRSSDWSPVPRAEVPTHTLHLLDCAEAGLAGLGFERVSTEAAVPFNACDPRAHMFTELYWQPGQATLARVELAEALTGQVTKTQFLSLFADGKALATVNREQWAQLPVPEEILVEDAYADDLAGQWQAHQQAMARERGHRVPVTDRDEAIRRQAALGFPRWLARMEELGWAREESSGCYRFTPRGAWGYSGQLAKPSAQARNALARPYRHDPAPDRMTARLAEMDSVAAVIALAAQPVPSWIKATLFTLTLVFSAILFGRGFDPLDAAALLTVLLIHELGHLAAMWVFDYRNLSIFFLPFLGAAATGHKPQAPAWQEAIVLLAGPVVGLALALAATQIPSEALPLPAIKFVRAFVWFGLALNLFNLLPVGVLDGGRLFELAVLGRFPYARAFFAGLGVVLGLIYAVWAKSMVLGVAMSLLLFGIPLQFKAARVIAAIRAKATGPESLDREEVIRALGREFADGDYGGSGAKGWAQRLNIARLAYPRLLQGIPGLGVSVGTLAAQGVALLAPLTLVVWFWRHPNPAPLMRSTAAEQRELDSQNEESPEAMQAKAARDEFLARYEALDDPQAQWAMLDQHEEEDLPGFDPAWLDRQRTALLERLPADHPAKLRHRLDEAEPGSATATETLLSVIAGLTADGSRKAVDLDDGRFELLVDAYTRLAAEAPPDVLEGQAAAVEALWTALESPGHPHAAHRRQLASIRAHMAFLTGKIDVAETWMDRYRACGGAESDDAALAHAWFLLDIGHHDQALALASRAIEMAKPRNVYRPQWQTLAGWAEIGRGHPREADAYFQAVLDDRAAHLAESRNSLPWWLRLLSWRADTELKARRWIDAQTLDHLAALEGYDPAEAARLLAELGKSVPQRQRQRGAYIRSTFDGWGKARETAHGRMLKALDLPQTAYLRDGHG